LLLGHRGVRGRRYGVQENSVAAFDLALDSGCDGFEFDVRLTADGRAVVCHDRKHGGVAVGECNLGQLSHLPLLEDVLARYWRRAFLDIELKVPGLESQILALLSAHIPQRGYVISSFIPEVLVDLHARNQSLPLGLICETRSQLVRWSGTPITHLIAKQTLVTPRLIGEVHAAGKQIFVWTVNQPQAMLRLWEWGVDGIISDRADVLVRAFAAGAPTSGA
jgi:glycerophosphoryl diester phosphodiesterase